MTKNQAKRLFENKMWEDENQGIPFDVEGTYLYNKSALKDKWSRFVDSLLNDRKITVEQFEIWSFPYSIDKQ